MQYGISILLSGISLGGQYALIAIGYTMVYGILRLINFAHGDVFMVAGLMMVYLSASLPLAAAIPLMIILTVLLGFIIERAVQPADHRGGIHQVCDGGHAGAGGASGGGPDPAHQPHPDRHGHAGGIPGF